MNDTNWVDLVSAMNHISLNQQDLMEALLSFNKIYASKNDEMLALMNRFMQNDEFIYQSMSSAREAIVLAMGALMLKEDIDFNNLVNDCVNLEMQKVSEDSVCDDDDTKAIMKDYLSSLRKELFSRIFSQNKEFHKVSGLPKTLLTNRFNIFMGRTF